MNITKSSSSKHLFRVISLWFYLDPDFSSSVHSYFSHVYIFLIVRAIDFLGKKWLVATSLFVELFSSPRKFEARTIGPCSLLKCFHHHAVGCYWMYSCLSLKFCPETSFGGWKNFSWNQCIWKQSYSQVSLSVSLENFQLALVRSCLEDGSIFPCKTLH